MIDQLNKRRLRDLGSVMWPRFCGLLLVLLVAVPSVDAQTQPAPSGEPDRVDRRILFALGNIEYILLHELAHLVIRDLEVPIIGSEESAADHMATIVLIDAEQFDAASARRAREYLLATANGLATSWEIYERAGESANYWDDHGLTIQRFYNVVCLLYGSDVVEFADLPAEVGLPERRAGRCADEYARASRSVSWLLENFGRSPGDVSDNPSTLELGPPPTRNTQRVMAAAATTGMLENTLRLFNERFAIPSPFQVSFRRCGRAQAEWMPEMRVLTVCYELVDFYYSLGSTRAATSRRSLQTR